MLAKMNGLIPGAKAHHDRTPWRWDNAPAGQGFLRLDWEAPLDVAAHLAATPSGATCKGLYLALLVDELRAKQRPLPTKGRFVAFKDYPLRQYMELSVYCARELYPDLPLRQGLRLLGHRIYPAFAESLLGRVVCGVLGNTISRVMQTVPKSYALNMSCAEVELLSMGADYAMVHLAQVPNFLDSEHVGVFEGVLHAFGLRGSVLYRPISLVEGTMLVEW